ncbi:hypothetical protein LOZ53_004505 [Ophidiomyces ophidiicola]|nr:hypothetical protein LOZ55_002307 [Ophidiomyces ophidiicola]KAI1986932.1 hypothetical protein LOZ53_004505 [Ophidiomyces ophidiicola]KAI1987419.1 hypothetical protein LOZ54_003591 [Ophidiomyces ophidiicola]KAI2001197.1 hypothetical protein LOZ51_001489 [Ophidiomyces ophidiicola]
MADYSSWKVADLKAELKRRGIPQTGLRLKQQFIDRLIQADSSGPNENAAENVATAEVASKPSAPDTSQQTGEPKEPSAAAPQVAEMSSLRDQAPATPQEVPEPATKSRDVAMPDVSQSVGQTSLEEAPPPRRTSHAIAISDLLQEAPSVRPSDEPTVPPEPEPPRVIESASHPSTTEPALSSEELDDSKKRKRRSQSPPPSPRSAALKRAKAEDGHPRVVLQEEEEPGKLGEVEVPVASTGPPVDSGDMKMDETQEGQDVTAEAQKLDSEGREETSQPEGDGPDRPIVEEPDLQDNREHHERPDDKYVVHREQETPQEQGDELAEDSHSTTKPHGDARFKDLFPSQNGIPSPRESSAPAEGEESASVPALHPATTSLYIRDFMRPLPTVALKRYLISLATPPHSTPDPDIILDFFLDIIKTHCFVTFTSISAASRVRTALHGTTWPDAGSRKPLWVDFVPEEKVKEWIDVEQASGNGRRNNSRWEVSYEDKEDGVVAVLHEATPNSRRLSRTQPFSTEPPTGPRAERSFGRNNRQAPPSTNISDSSFKALDDRFASTSAKPKLYYLPVAKEVSDKRLDRFEDLARTGPTRKPGGDEMRRYTFEDNDFFVDHGPEYGARRGRAPRGRGGGGFGEWGGSWRGRR